MSNPAARAARNEALKRHRREVGFWKGLLIPVSGTALFVGVAVGMLAQKAITPDPPQPWRTGDGPPDRDVIVVTEGYFDKRERVWKSFDNGMRIEVKHWMPKP